MTDVFPITVHNNNNATLFFQISRVGTFFADLNNALSQKYTLGHQFYLVYFYLTVQKI